MPNQVIRNLGVASSLSPQPGTAAVASFSISIRCKYLCWCKESAELTTSSRTLSKPFIAKESHHHNYTSLESALMLKSNVRYQSYKSLLDWANFIYFQPYQLIYYLARSKRIKGLCVSPISHCWRWTFEFKVFRTKIENNLPNRLWNSVFHLFVAIIKQRYFILVLAFLSNVLA